MSLCIKLLPICVLAVTLSGAVKTYSTYNAKTIKPVSIPSTNGFDMLITDDMLVNTYYNWAQTLRFFDAFPGCILTYQERSDIYNAAKRWHINIIALVTKIECESSIITWGCGKSAKYDYRKTWCLGAGMYTTINSNGRIIKPYAGFQRQVDHGAYTLRRHYNAWTNGMMVRINEGMYNVKPRNAATYALYRYTPFHGTWEENGVVCGGNEYTVLCYKRMKKIWEDVNK